MKHIILLNKVRATFNRSDTDNGPVEQSRSLAVVATMTDETGRRVP